MKKEKICFIVQRYGIEVNGGAELHCRQLAEKMRRYYHVEVFTTCARDYITWKSEYKAGTERINGVLVHRFPVSQKRNITRFGKMSEKVLSNPDHSDKDELQWIRAQGPLCDSLLKELQRVHKEYKAVIFMTYLYYLTAMGLPMKFENALLIPTVHDEPPVYLRYYQKVFESAKGIIWNTPAERGFAEKRFRNIKVIPGIIAGVGVDIPAGELSFLPDGLKMEKYIVYAGRIDESKGCKRMFDTFLAYSRKYDRDIKLVVMGKEVLKVPSDNAIVYLGFVPDKVKFSVIKHAKALVLFSEYESLSMVVLESMIMGRPVLVNGNCDVLKEHCIRSNAGLYFYNSCEFDRELEYLYSHDKEYRIMCKNGKTYVNEYYRWDVITERIKNLIDQVCV